MAVNNLSRISMKRLCTASFSVPIVCFLAANVLCGRGISNAAITPDAVLAGSSQVGTVTATVTGDGLYVSSVAVYQTTAQGSPIAFLGQLYDDGTHGDVTAGDSVFTAQVGLSPQTAGDLYFRVTAAFRGIRNRYLSPILQVTAYNPVPTVKTVVQLPVLQDHDIQMANLTISTLFEKNTLSTGETTGIGIFADADQGQIMFVDNPDGTPLAIAYFTSNEIHSGTVSVTLDSIAQGLIMCNPIMLGYTENDRLAILQKAEQDPLYYTLKDQIAGALNTEPNNLLQVAVFPEIYRSALGLVVDAIQGSKQLAPNLAPMTLGGAQTLTVIGNTNNIHVTDVTGPGILVVNPTMVFYGVNINGVPPQVIAGKDSLWQLNLGWPPAGFTDPVTQSITLGDGTFHAQFLKYGFDSQAGIMATEANFLRGACDVLDAVAWCPASNSLIKSIVEGSLTDALVQAGKDIFTINSPDDVLDRVQLIIDELTKPDVWAGVTQTIYRSVTDADAAALFLQSSKAVLEAAKVVLDSYNAANVYIPFVWDLITQPNDVEFCMSQEAGVLSSTCQQIPPTAVITKLSPATVHVGDTVVFDASQSSDDNTSLNSLQVRWDFDGDGVFDTGWSTSKQASYSYSTQGADTVRLEVMDSDGLVGQSVYTISVSATTAAGTATHIKEFQDLPPWNTTSFQDTMAANGYSVGPGTHQYEILSSTEFATDLLVPGQDLVVIANDQPQTFYDHLSQSISRLDRFIQNGGVVIWGACDLGWNMGSMQSAGITALPGNVGFQARFDYTNYNVDPTSQLMSGLPNTLTGTYASHEHFSNLPAGSVVYTVDTSEDPTLIEYKYGSGWMIVTGQPLEYNVKYNVDSMGLLYSRLFNYVLGRVALGSMVQPAPALESLAEPPPALSHIGK